jgi:hypothetical protein
MGIPLQEALFPVRREIHPRCEQGRLILFTPKMEAICPHKTSVLTGATWRHDIPEDGVLQYNSTFTGLQSMPEEYRLLHIIITILYVILHPVWSLKDDG